jgi:hypothetical protein
MFRPITIDKIKHTLASIDSVTVYDPTPSYDRLNRLIELTDASPYWDGPVKGKIDESTLKAYPCYLLEAKPNLVGSALRNTTNVQDVWLIPDVPELNKVNKPEW